MPLDTPSLDLGADVVTLTAALVDIESVSRNEQQIADEVEAALRPLEHLEVTRHGHTVVARTDLGRGQRVVIAGHLDTVPVNDNWPSTREQTPDGDVLRGLGTCDMKGGDAVILRLAATVAEPVHDVTYILYEAEEIDSAYNGLYLLSQSHPELLAADFAILMEPSKAGVEAGCQGTMRVAVTTTGSRAHSARAWMGDNAIHRAGGILARLSAYEARRPEIDGLVYHEGLNATAISGGVAGNVIPDRCRVEVNHRFAPDRSAEEAEAYVREFFEGYDVELLDAVGGALPGLDVPAAKAFVETVGGHANPKFGWTDVARFSAMGVPAVNYGPGDPSLAHHRDEHVPVAQIEECERRLVAWLTGAEGMTTGAEKHRGPEVMRRGQIDGSTTDQRLLDTRESGGFIHTDPWRVLRIQAEFVEGFGALAELGPAIGVFGSARTPPDHPTYAVAEEVGRKLAEAGFAVITGGGPGAMEAANKGASEAGGVSVGLGIELPFEAGLNRWVDKGINFRYFFARKTMFVKYAQGFVVLPGGLGTFDELFEAMTLAQTGKITSFPVVLVGSAYWQGLLDWLHGTVLAEGKIGPRDLDMVTLTDDVDEAVRLMVEASAKDGPDEEWAG